MNNSNKTRLVNVAIGLPASLPGIDIADTLRRIGNKPALLFELLCELVQEHVGTPERIQALLLQGDVAEATRLAHSVKGIAMNLGCNTLAAAAKDLETTLVSGSSDLERQLSATAAALAEVQDSVAILRAQHGPQP